MNTTSTSTSADVKDCTKFWLRIGVVLGGNPFTGNGANCYADF